MTVTTEEAEQLAELLAAHELPTTGFAVRSLAAERDALQARAAKLEGAIKRWVEADDAGDGQECINAIAYARAMVEGKKS